MDVLQHAMAAGLLAIDAAAAVSASVFPHRPTRPYCSDVGSSLSVLIPERGTPELLERCLESVWAAATRLDVPLQVLVIVNGHPPAAYRAHAGRFAGTEWMHEPRAIGFGGAVQQGLRAVRGEWVYLLNSDMVVAQDALSMLWQFRDGHTFAIASQIHLADRNRRREETGWTDFVVRDGIVEHLDRIPEDEVRLRGHLYAGGGASLFRTELLRRYIRTTGSYGPFYFEDTDWGMQACRAGLHTKFCPLSRVVHEHRATISRYFDAEEIERVIRRNVVLFEARHGLGGRRTLLRRLPSKTRRELTHSATLFELCMQRWRTRRALRAGMAPECSALTIFNAPLDDRRSTRVVAVSGALADHADAVARATLAAGLDNLVLLTDDRAAFEAPPPWTSRFNVIHGMARVAPGDRSSQRRFDASVAWWSRVYGVEVRTLRPIPASQHAMPPRKRAEEVKASVDAR